MNGPLAGFSVIEVGSFVAAPLATRLLAEFGADVIKIEAPPNGDPMRAWEGGHNSAWFAANNRGKRSLALDLRNNDARPTIEALITRADVLVENLRPGSPEMLGIGWIQARQLNPRLVYCSISGFGEASRETGRTYDTIGQALSGMLSLMSDGLVVPGLALADTIAAHYAAMGVLAALHERALTGRGQFVTTSLLESSLALLAEPLTVYLRTGQLPDARSRSQAAQAFVFTCAEGLRLAVHISSSEQLWNQLLLIVDRVDLESDPRFRSRALRIRNHSQLSEELAGSIRRESRDVWLSRLRSGGVPSAPVNNIAEALLDPHVAALKIVDFGTSPEGDLVPSIRPPVSFDGVAPRLGPAPAFGQHSAEILAELRGR